MATLTFNSISVPPRRQAARQIRRTPARPVALSARPAEPITRRVAPSSVLLVGAIIALHAGVVLSLTHATRSIGAAPAAQPITIALAPPPKVEPPPPPPPPKPEPPAPRPKAALPRPAAMPVVAPETPLVDASADTVQVARAPVEAAPDPAPAAPPAPKVEEPLTEPKGYAGYLRNPAPDYPPAAQKRGLEGKVVLKVHVLASGQPDTVTVAKSSGHQILDDAALKAVTQWAFAPARRGQTAVDGWVHVPLTFKI